MELKIGKNKKVGCEFVRHQSMNFCDPHWELICRNKWHPGTSEISTPPDIAVGTHFHAQHGTKTTPVFLPTDGEASWSLRPSLVLLTIKPAECSEKTPIPVSYQNRISINTNHSYRQCSSPKASLNWSNKKGRFSFNLPNRKRWGAKLIDVIKHLPNQAFYCETITRRVANQGWRGTFSP